MSQVPLLQIRGLDTSRSHLSGQGLTFELMRNCLIRSKDIIEPRRGMVQSAASFPAAIGTPDALFAWGPSSALPYLYAHTTGDKIVNTQDGTSFGTLSGSFTPPNGLIQRMRWADAQRRLYWTTFAGPYRSLTAGSTTDAARAGQETPSIDWAVSRASTLGAGFFPNDTAAVFRAWIVQKDAQGLEIVGEVSDPVMLVNPPLSTVADNGLVRLTNVVTVTCTAVHGFKVGDVPYLTLGGAEANFTAGNKTIASVPTATTFTFAEVGANATSGAPATKHTFAYGAAQWNVRVRLPSGTTTSHILRVARSRSVTPASQTPQPDVFQVYETLPTATDVSNGYVDVVDNTPDGLLGPICYVSPGADGALRNNVMPPVVNDLTVFNDCLFGANTRERHRLELQLLATGGTTGGLQATDTFVIVRGATTVTETFGTSYGVDAPTVYNTGVVTTDIERTARSLVAAINASANAATAGVRARYLSDVQDSPGRILIEATDYTTTSFTVKCAARPLAWQPTLGTTPSTRVSTQAVRANRLVFSRPGEPDAFCAIQYLDVGGADDPVLRILALNESLVVLKQRSAWIVSGAYPYFSARPLDMDCATVAADTAAVLSNMVHVLTTQGVALVSESGVGLIGLPVERDTFTTYDVTKHWGCAYGSEHSYYLSINSTYGRGILVWNAMLKTWSGPLVPQAGNVWTHGVVLPAASAGGYGNLWMAESTTPNLWAELKDSSASDYTDGDAYLSTTISANDGAGNLTCSSVAGVLVGDTISSAALAAGYCVTAINGSVLTVYPVPPAAFTGAKTVARGIDCLLLTSPIQAPVATEKALREVRLHWRTRRAQLIIVGASSSYDTTFATDYPLTQLGTDPAYTQISISGETLVGSDSPFVRGPADLPCAVAASVVRGEGHRVLIRIRGAFNRWSLEGITLIYADGSTERTRRA